MSMNLTTRIKKSEDHDEQLLSSTPSEEAFLSRIETHAKYKRRSYDTDHNAHMPEVTLRLNLDSPLGTTTAPNLAKKQKINIVYRGNSMLERLKTTGKSTRLANPAVT